MCEKVEKQLESTQDQTIQETIQDMRSLQPFLQSDIFRSSSSTGLSLGKSSRASTQDVFRLTKNNICLS